MTGKRDINKLSLCVLRYCMYIVCDCMCLVHAVRRACSSVLCDCCAVQYVGGLKWSGLVSYRSMTLFTLDSYSTAMF